MPNTTLRRPYLPRLRPSTLYSYLFLRILRPAAETPQFDGTDGTVMDQQAVLTDSTADFWPRVPLQQPADRSRAPLHRLTPGFRMRGTERNNDMISVANAIQGPVVV